MIAIDVATLLIVVAAVVGGITAFSSHHAQTKAIKAAPDHRLGTAIRLLDRIIQSDDAGFANLPEALKKEAQQVVDEYYK